MYEYVIERPLRWASLGGADGGRLMTPPTLRLLSSRRLDGDGHHQVLPFELPEVSPRRLGYKARFAYTSCLSGGGDKKGESLDEESSCGGGGDKKGESLDEESSCGIADCVQKLDLHALAAGTAPLRAALARFEGKIAGSPLFVPRDPLVDEVVDDGAHLSAHVSGDTGSVSDQDDGSVSDEDDGYVLSFVYDPLAHTSQLVILDAKHVGGEPVATVALEQHVPMFFHGCWVPECQMELIGQLDSNE